MAAAAYDCDVLIVGAGPTGSVLALLLARRGVSVLLADRETGIYPLPRAAHIDHEAMRIFQAVGLAAPIAASSRQAPRYDFLNANGDVLLRFDGSDAIGPGGWPTANMIHQPSIERALRSALVDAADVQLRTGWSLAELSEGGDGVTAVFDGPDGVTHVSSRFAVGADGARSPVRALSGIGVDDLDFDEPWLVIDTIVQDPSRLPTINLQICDPARPTTCVLMGAGRHRWEFMLRPGETAEQVMDDAFVARLLAPWNIEGAVEIERKAVYRFNARVAEEWRRGRVLLAGDAAHLMPPFAGQGLCSGLRDAANLSWKLAAILKDGAPGTPLLATYQAEREPHVRAIIGLAMMMGRTVCLLDADAAAARDVQMIAARAAGPGARPAGWPPFATGCILAGSPGAGSYFPQIASDAADGARFDDILGDGAWLITRGPVAAPHPAYHAATVDDPALAPFRAGLIRWLDGTGAGAQSVLVRPDRYVFGTGEPEIVARAFLSFVAPSRAAPAASPTPISSSKEQVMSLDGIYDVIVKSPLGDQKSTLTVKTDGSSFIGRNVGATANNEIAGTVEGHTLAWQEKISVPIPMTLDMTATVEGDTLSGTVKAGAFGSFPMTGARAS